MPAIPIDTRAISQELGEHLNYYVAKSSQELGEHLNYYVARSIDHRALEVIAVRKSCSRTYLFNLSNDLTCSSGYNHLRRGRLHVLRHQGPKQIEEAPRPGPEYMNFDDGLCFEKSGI